jgi:HAD superfamily hydrolase (TIGR01509 family)
MIDTHTNRYDLIIFDCDGVLVDSELLSGSAVIDCLMRQGIEVNLDTVFDELLGRSPRAIDEFCARLGRSLPQAFYGELQARVRAAFAGALKPIAGAATVLKNLRAPYCVASSSGLDRMDYSLQLSGLSALVDGRLFSAEMVRRGKPAPDLFLHAAAGMGAAPGRTLVVEDSVSGVTAGKAAGMTVWGFVGGSHYVDRDGRTLLMAAGADRVFDRMAEFYRDGGGLLERAVR